MCGLSIRRMTFVIRTLFLINGSFSTPKKKAHGQARAERESNPTAAGESCVDR